MRKSCEISIIIPVFNARKYIMRCLQSIKAQTFRNYEIIIVDDHSTDGTISIIEKFINENPYLSYMLVKNHTNMGDTCARNKGMRMAHGKYLCTIDADDAYHPEFLAALYKKITETNTDLVFCGYDRCFPQKTISYSSTWSYPEHHNIIRLKCAFFMSKTHICHCTVLHNRDFLEKHGLQYTDGCRHAGDTEFIIKELFCHPKFACVPETLYYYYIHENSISTSYPTESKFDGYYAYERVKKQMKNPLWKIFFTLTRESREVFHILDAFYGQKAELPFLFCSRYKILGLLTINALRKYKKAEVAVRILRLFYTQYFKKEYK